MRDRRVHFSFDLFFFYTRKENLIYFFLTTCNTRTRELCVCGVFRIEAGTKKKKNRFNPVVRKCDFVVVSPTHDDYHHHRVNRKNYSENDEFRVHATGGKRETKKNTLGRVNIVKCYLFIYLFFVTLHAPLAVNRGMQNRRFFLFSALRK